jgi:hypothetical protein
MIRRIASATFGLVAALTGALSASAETYRNGEFGFSVEMSRGVPVCVPDPTLQHVHGITFWLDSGRTGCDELEGRPAVSAIGEYNSLFYPSTQALAKDSCGQHGKRVAAPPGLAIPGARSATCRRNEDDGWITMAVVAQGGTWRDPGNDPDFHTPAVNYIVLMHTRGDHFDADLARFRAILKTVRLFKPAM